MLVREKKPFKWLEFELLKPYPELIHGVFVQTKDHQIKDKHVQDEITKLLGLQGLYVDKGEHKDRIIEARHGSPQEVADGLLTTEKGLGLVITHADCQAVIVFDPVKKIVANIHAGWRGQVQNILGKGISLLIKTKGCNPKDLRVCISPSLGPSHAEFIHYEREFPASFHAYRKNNYFDLWKISEDQLIEMGVLEKHIEIARICTFKEEDLFFSYRRNRTHLRNFTVAGFV